MPRGESTNPRVTVLITAFRRQHYLMDAIRSVLNSTLERSAYEIILVIDEIDPDLAARVEELGVVIERVKTVLGGEMWAAGLRAARAEVIAFLDDDDCFYPDKLSTVLRVFEDPAVVWYHNGFQRVDEGRTPISTPTPGRRETRVYPSPISRKDLGQIRCAGGFYNNSSHSVRRAALAENRDAFLEVTFGQDFAIPLLTSGEGKVVIDLPNILTEFRTHWSQGSHPFTGSRMPEPHAQFLRGIVRTFYWLAQRAPTADARSFSRCRAESYETLIWATRGESIGDPRGAVPRAVRGILGNLQEGDRFNATILALLLSLAPFSRRLTEAVYTAMKRVEMRTFGLDVSD